MVLRRKRTRADVAGSTFPSSLALFDPTFLPSVSTPQPLCVMQRVPALPEAPCSILVLGFSAHAVQSHLMLYSSDEHGAFAHGYSLICFRVLLRLVFAFLAISPYPIYSFFCDSALPGDLTAAVAAAARLVMVSAPSSPPPPPTPPRSSSARSLGTRQAAHPPAAEDLASGRSPATPVRRHLPCVRGGAYLHRPIVGSRAHRTSTASHSSSAAFRRPSHFRKLRTTGLQMSSYVSPDAWILCKAMSSV